MEEFKRDENGMVDRLIEGCDPRRLSLKEWAVDTREFVRVGALLFWVQMTVQDIETLAANVVALEAASGETAETWPRARKVSEELPPPNTWVLIGWAVDAQIAPKIAYTYDGTWRDREGAPSSRPAFWWPLPETPE